MPGKSPESTLLKVILVYPHSKIQA